MSEILELSKAQKHATRVALRVLECADLQYIIIAAANSESGKALSVKADTDCNIRFIRTGIEILKQREKDYKEALDVKEQENNA